MMFKPHPPLIITNLKFPWTKDEEGNSKTKEATSIQTCAQLHLSKLNLPKFLGKNTFYVEMSMLQATMAIVLQPTKIFTVQSMYMYIHSNVHVHVIKYRQ